MISINNEFISYEDLSIAGSVVEFSDCYRGRRQAVNQLPSLTGEDSTLSHRTMPDHPEGSKIWPGGFSIKTDNTLYRGGCTLKSSPNSANPTQGPLAGNKDSNRFIYGHTTNPISNSTTTPFTITLDDASFFHDFGFIKVSGQTDVDTSPADGEYDIVTEFMYYKKTSSTTLEVQSRKELDSANTDTVKNFIIPLSTDPMKNSKYSDHIEVRLISWPVLGNPKGRYKTASNFAHKPNEIHPTDPNKSRTSYDSALLQLYDTTSATSPTYGNIEWIRYTDFTTEPKNGNYYFINRNGLGSGRGYYNTTSPSTQFPPGTKLIPVQNVGHKGHLFEKGDVVTISPKALGSINQHLRIGTTSHTNNKINTWQAVIRNVYINTTDGVDTWAGTAPYPNTDALFAFTDEIPEMGNAQKITVWPAFATEDLSPYTDMKTNANDLKVDGLPFINAWDTNFGMSGDDRKVFIAQQSDKMEAASNHLPTPHLDSADATFDTIMARVPVSGTAHKPARILNISPAGGGGYGDVIEVSKSNTGFSDANADRSGLILINGEVLAYVIENTGTINAELTIVGRGLLGSDLSTGYANDDEVIRLPFGPVAVLSNSITDSTIGLVDLQDVAGYSNDVNQFGSKVHSFLFMKRDGSAFESIQLIAESGQYYTAPWLRGMYNTPIQDWTTNDLVIAWTPRFASALRPDNTHLSSQEHRSALLRSRCYAWLGAPLRLFGMSLPGDAMTPSVQVTVGHNPQGTPFDFELRMLDKGFDWADASVPYAASVKPLDAGDLNLPAICNSEWTPDGGDMELRVHWRYSDPVIDGTAPIHEQLLQLYDNAGRAASIDKVEIQVKTGVKILDASTVK